MAIAPLDDARDQGSGRRGGLRLIEGGRTAGAAPRGTALHARADDAEARRRARAAHPTARVPSAPRAMARSTEARTPAVARATTLARRRRTAALSVVVLSVVLLALPLRALGAVTVDGRSTPGGVPAGLAPGSVYVVQPGDSLASIARAVNPAAAATIEHQLAVASGSASVVPGEHVRIP